MKNNKNNITVNDTDKLLEQGLENIFKSDRFKELLQVMANVPHYSENNIALILAQKPDATMIQPGKAWAEMGRYINKDEQALRILKPRFSEEKQELIDSKTGKPVRDSKGEKMYKTDKTIVGFVSVPVYDISQTNGKDVPNIHDYIKREMQDDEHISLLYKDYSKYINENTSNAVSEEATKEGVGGYYSRATDNIVISNTENNNDTEKFRVLIHELAHARVHHKESELKDLPRGHKEAQAESVAFMVSSYYGMDMEDVSVGYIAHWAEDLDLAKQAIREVRDIANQMIEEIDTLQQEKIAEFYEDTEKPYNDAISLLKENYGISINDKELNQFELLEPNRGLVISAKLDESNYTNKAILRTDRNMIIPLSSISETERDYLVLNVEINKGELKGLTEQKDIKDALKLDNNHVIDKKDNTVISSFETKEEATNFMGRLEVAQKLHQDSFYGKSLEKGTETREQTLKLTQANINKAVSDYLSSETTNFQASGKDGTTIGWALMKNKQLKSIEDIENHIESAPKQVRSITTLKEAVEKSVVKDTEYELEM